MPQTIGNSHPGGESGGLFNAENLSMLPAENSAARPPTASGIAKNIKGFSRDDFIISPRWYTMNLCMYLCKNGAAAI